MKRSLVITISFSLLLLAPGVAQKRVSAPAKPQAVSSPATPASGTNVSVATVEAFLHRMFGQDPSVKWRVLDISPSEAPNITKVTVVVGDDPRPSVLYVTPDGEHAILGEVIPFGAEPFAATRKKLDAQADGPRRGATKTPEITIVEFSDLQCPHCKAAQPVIDRLMADYPNAQLVFEHFPLGNHKWAAEAAALGVCVAQQNNGAFWKYVNGVFEKQETIPEATPTGALASIVKSAGADPVKASECAKLPETTQRVQRSIDLGRAVGVNGTPTVFINGRKLPSIKDIPYEALKQLVDFEAQQGKTAPAQSAQSR